MKYIISNTTGDGFTFPNPSNPHELNGLPLRECSTWNTMQGFCVAPRAPSPRPLRASLIDQRQRLLFRRRRRFQLQLLLPAESGHFSAVGLKVALRGLESFLCFVQILANVFKLILEKVEGLLRLRKFGAALLKTFGDLVPLVDERDRMQRHQQRVG